jgi:hypothetical protein
MSEERKICPIMSGGNVTQVCIGEKCALWHDSEKCGVLAIAHAIDDMAVIMDELNK